jgi:TonB family protein
MAHSLGFFDLPGGLDSGKSAVKASGIRSTVATVEFGSGIAVGNSSRVDARTVRAAGFAELPPIKGAQIAAAASAETPVHILSKPKPTYTEEARQLRLEGEVVLEVVFSVVGECRVLNVVHGLGHGLDEAAIRVAERISFRPASRGGKPVDSTAIIHVVFQLA